MLFGKTETHSQTETHSDTITDKHNCHVVVNAALDEKTCHLKDHYHEQNGRVHSNWRDILLLFCFALLALVLTYLLVKLIAGRKIKKLQMLQRWLKGSSNVSGDKMEAPSSVFTVPMPPTGPYGQPYLPSPYKATNLFQQPRVNERHANGRRSNERGYRSNNEDEDR
ncbi:unnamed protein product [Didymodactylos carnosus]|uniref:Uncharacterized protein n=1 Tax=Didymodactylos carnosus TaxID=1234261 RepID=A0A8S2Z9H4_9BILA|nr:unnamed protein product [Didymodactylos carnosus]